MKKISRRTTVYFDPDVQKALRVKAAVTGLSLSELVHRAVCRMLDEDSEDLAAFDARAKEGTRAYEDVLKELKSRGKL